MKLAVIVALCVSFLGAISAFVILTALGKDTTAYVGFISMAGGSLIAQIANLFKTSNVESQNEQISADMQEVKKATNGPLAAAVTQISEVHTAMVQQNGTDK